MKIHKKNKKIFLGGGGSGWGGGGGGVRMDVNEELKFVYFWGGSGRGGGVVLGGQGRFEQRSEVFAKIKKKFVGGVGFRLGGGGSGWM